MEDVEKSEMLMWNRVLNSMYNACMEGDVS
jgi:hypothetical protein